jgi:hypothetical protein
VASRRLGNVGATHLTPAFSPRKRAERGKMAVDDCTRSRHRAYKLANFELTRSVISIAPGA